MKNKKGQAFVIPIIAFVIVAVAIAVVLIVGSFSILFSQLKYFAIGGAIILVSIIFGFKTGWSEDKGKYILLFIIIGSLFILIPAFGILQETFGGTTYLSISNVEVIDKGARIIVYGVAGTGAEDIKINFNKEELNNKLNSQGYSATQDVVGRILLTKQIKKFGLEQNQDEIFYKLKIVNIGRLTFCSTSSCKKNTPSGYIFADTAFRSPTLVCMCLYKRNEGINALFTGSEIEDSEISVTIGSASGVLKPSQGINTLRLNDGKTFIEWTGGLNNYYQITAPNYAGLYKGSQFNKLISPNAFALYKDEVLKFGNCLGSTNFNYYALVSPVWLLLNTKVSTATTCVNNFNTKLDNLLSSKTSIYENSINAKDVSFTTNTMDVDLKVATSFPTFKITLDAKSVGIIELKGKPKIISCVSDKTISSGETYSTSITVKNIGANDGSFSGQFSCSNAVITGYISEVFVTKDSTVNIPAQFSGEKITEGENIGNCKVTITDRKSGDSDVCYFKLKVKYQGGIICEPFSIKCIDSKTLRICSSDGMTFEDKKCDEKCIVDNKGVGKCLSKAIPEDECAWWQESYTRVEKDYGVAYWRLLFGNPKITETQDCRVAGWLNLLMIGGVILILGIILIVVWKPKRNIKTKKRFKR